MKNRGSDWAAEASDYVLRHMRPGQTKPEPVEIRRILSAWPKPRGVKAEKLKSIFREAKGIVEAELRMRDLAARARRVMSPEQLSELSRLAGVNTPVMPSSAELAHELRYPPTFTRAAMFERLQMPARGVTARQPWKRRPIDRKSRRSGR